MISQTLPAKAVRAPEVEETDGPDAPLVVRPIQGPAELETVYRMTHDAYVDMGFIEPRPGGKLIHYPHLDAAPGTSILVAVKDGQIVGTNSIAVDGPAGLHTDEDFPEETDRVRREGTAIASSYRINTLKEVRNGKAIVMSLIRETAFILQDRHIATCLFIFHKRHERIYRRLLGMALIAERPEIACVSHFPAVLMRCEMALLPDWCRRVPAGGQDR